MEALPREEVERLVRAALAEDVGSGDVTTLATVPENMQARAAMVAREPLVVAGLALAEAAFTGLSPKVAFGLNYPEFPDRCRRVEFTLLVDVLEMLVDGAGVLLKQFGHELLREPDGLVLKAALDAGLAVLGLVEDDLSTLRDGLL